MEQQLNVKNKQDFKACIIKIEDDIQYLRNLSPVSCHSSLYGHLVMAGYALMLAKNDCWQLGPFDTTLD